MVFPLALGSLIYVALRDDSLIVFQWFDATGLRGIVNEARGLVSASLHPVLLYSLPDGLWAYSFSSVMAFIWSGHKAKFVLVLSIPVLGVLGEVGQLLSIIRGTFDIYDVVFYVLAGIMVYINLLYRKGVHNEKDYLDTHRMLGIWSFGSGKHKQ